MEHNLFQGLKPQLFFPAFLFFLQCRGTEGFPSPHSVRTWAVDWGRQIVLGERTTTDLCQSLLSMVKSRMA